MLAPDWAQKMLLIIVPSRRTASPEFFSWVRTRLLLSRHTCPVRSPMLCVQGELSFSTLLEFPNQNRIERTTDESEKHFWCYQQEHFNLHRENSAFWPTTITRTSTASRQNNTFARVSRFFVHFFAVTARLPRENKMPNFTFWGGRKQATTKFLSLSELAQVDRNSAPEESVCIWQSKRVGKITIETEKTQIHFWSDVFEAVSHRSISKLPNI